MKNIREVPSIFYRIAQKQENYPIYLITPSDIEEIRMMDPQYWQD